MKTTDLRKKSVAELTAIVSEKRAELVDKHRALQAGELTNPRSITVLRREIATTLTLLKEAAAKEKA